METYSNCIRNGIYHDKHDAGSFIVKVSHISFHFDDDCFDLSHPLKHSDFTEYCRSLTKVSEIDDSAVALHRDILHHEVKIDAMIKMAYLHKLNLCVTHGTVTTAFSMGFPDTMSVLMKDGRVYKHNSDEISERRVRMCYVDFGFSDFDNAYIMSKWADVTEPEETDDDEPEDMSDIVGDSEISHIEEAEIEDSRACCYFVGDGYANISSSIQTLMKRLSVEYIPPPCQLNMMLTFLNKFLGLTNYGELSVVASLWMKMRHEFLARTVMVACNLGYHATDVPLSRYVDDSKRTPDIIIDRDDIIYIVEVTAVSDVYRGYEMKGGEGFDAKYAREISIYNEDKNKSKKMEYLPIIFDMKTGNIANNKHIFEKIDKTYNMSLITSSVEAMHSVSEIFYQKFGYIIKSAIKSSLQPTTKIDHKLKLDFMHNKNAQTYCFVGTGFTTEMINKFINSFTYFNRQLSKENPKQKMVIVYDFSTKNYTFRRDKKGTEVGELIEMMGKKNTESLLRLVKLSKAGKEYKAGDINFAEKNQSDVFNIFKDQIKSNLEVDSDMIKSSHTYDLPDYFEPAPVPAEVQPVYYKSKFADIDYEDKLIKAMIKDDTWIKYSPKMLVNHKPDLDLIQMDVARHITHQKHINVTTSFKSVYPFSYPVPDLNSSSHIDLSGKPDILDMQTGSLLLDDILKRLSNTSGIFGKADKTEYPTYDCLQSVKGDLNSQRNKYVSRIIKIKNSIDRSTTAQQKEDSIKDLDSKKTIVEKLISDNEKELNDYLKKHKDSMKKERNFMIMDNDMYGKFKNEVKELWGSDNIKNTTRGVSCFFSDSDTVEKGHLFLYDSLVEFLVKMRNADFPLPEIRNPANDHSSDVAVFKELKNLYASEYKNIIELLNRTNMALILSFIQNFCRSLFFYSQSAAGKKVLFADNLGCGDVLLLVKGGKKIFNTKVSKFYRMIFPINNLLLDLMAGCNGTHYRMINHKDKTYLVTPWMQMKESVLMDGCSIYSRCMGSMVLQSSEMKGAEDDMIRKMCFPVMLAINNKRKIEVMMANMRYLSMNLMGKYGQSSSLIAEFDGLNKDFFQSYIRWCIATRYVKFAADIRGTMIEEHVDFEKVDIQNIYTGHRIDNDYEFTQLLYNTYLMSKGNYNSTLEQSSNLKGIIDVHNDWVKNFGVGNSLEAQTEMLAVTLDDEGMGKYIYNLFDAPGSDFKYDPKICYNMGVFLADYLNEKSVSGDINSFYSNYMEKSWTSIAGSHGLRGKGDNFFGMKGYPVVYDDFLADKDVLVELQKLMASDLSDGEKRESLSKLHENFYDKMENQISGIKAHVVDKTQWKGGREIYVFEKDTKIYHAPLEATFGYIASMIPNELISVPSNKRLSKIHSMLFEKESRNKDSSTAFLTLDCRKWAPKSTIPKLMVFLQGFSKILPPDFMELCMSFLSKMVEKKVYTRDKVLKILTNNKKYTDEEAYKISFSLFKGDEDVKGAVYFEMEYSWLMGWFNYLSSIIHSAAQLYHKHLSTVYLVKKYSEVAIPKCVAHSDDSGGSIEYRKLKAEGESHLGEDIILEESFSTLQLLMKGGNMMYSDKKSMISELVFELLSIFYKDKKLLAMTPKFFSSIILKPTDLGPVGDMTMAISKCIEFLSYGATFSQAYMAMGIYATSVENMIYGGKQWVDMVDTPLQMLGYPDAHPAIVMMCGAEADIVRITSISPELASFYFKFSNFICDEDESGDMMKTFPFKSRIRIDREDFAKSLGFPSLFDNWAFKHCNIENTFVKAAQYAIMKTDPHFISSLRAESSSRMLSRTMHNAGHKILGYKALDRGTHYGKLLTTPFKLRDLMKLCILKKNVGDPTYFEVVKAEGDGAKTFSMFCKLNADVLEFNNHMNRLVGKMRMEESHVSLKPTAINVRLLYEKPLIKSNVANLTAFIKMPEMRFILNRPTTLGVDLKMWNLFMDRIGQEVESLSMNQMYKLLSRYTRDSVLTINMYARVPSNMRSITDYNSLLTLICCNSIPGKQICDLTLPFRDYEFYKNEVLRLAVGYSPEITEVLKIYYVFTTFIASDKRAVLDDLILTSKVLNFEGNIHNWGNFFKARFVCESRQSRLIGHALETVTKMAESLDSMSESKVKLDLDLLNRTNWYVYSRPQVRHERGWFGVGSIRISAFQRMFSISIENRNINLITTSDYIGQVCDEDVKYLDSVLMEMNCKTLYQSLDDAENIEPNKVVIGVNDNGGWEVAPAKRLIRAFSNYKSSILINDELGSILNYELFTTRANHFELVKYSEDRVVKHTVHFMQTNVRFVMNNFSELIMPDKNTFLKNDQVVNEFMNFITNTYFNSVGTDLMLARNTFIERWASTKLVKVIKNSGVDFTAYKETRLNEFINGIGSFLDILFKAKKNMGDLEFYPPEHIGRDLLTLEAMGEGAAPILYSKLTEISKTLYSREDLEKAAAELADINDPMNNADALREYMKRWAISGLQGAVMLSGSYKSADNFKIYTTSLLTNDMKLCRSIVRGFYDAVMISIKHVNLNMESDSLHFDGLVFKDKKTWFNYINDSFKVSFIAQMPCKSLVPKLFYASHSPIMEAISMVLKDDVARSSFEKVFSEVYFLSRLPVEYAYYENICALFFTALRVYIALNKFSTIYEYNGQGLDSDEDEPDISDVMNSMKDVFDATIYNKKKKPYMISSRVYEDDNSIMRFSESDITSFFLPTNTIIKGPVDFTDEDVLEEETELMYGGPPTKIEEMQVSLDKFYRMKSGKGSDGKKKIFVDVKIKICIGKDISAKDVVWENLPYALVITDQVMNPDGLRAVEAYEYKPLGRNAVFTPAFTFEVPLLRYYLLCSIPISKRNILRIGQILNAQEITIERPFLYTLDTAGNTQKYTGGAINYLKGAHFVNKVGSEEWMRIMEEYESLKVVFTKEEMSMLLASERLSVQATSALKAHLRGMAEKHMSIKLGDAETARKFKDMMDDALSKANYNFAKASWVFRDEQQKLKRIANTKSSDMKNSSLKLAASEGLQIDAVLEAKADTDLNEMAITEILGLVGQIDPSVLVEKGVELARNAASSVEREQMTRFPTYFEIVKSLNVVKPHTLRDRQLKAELNAISKDLSGHLLSGTLVITQKKFDLIKKQIRMMGRFAKTYAFKFANQVVNMILMSTTLDVSGKSTDKLNDIWDNVMSYYTDAADKEDLEVEMEAIGEGDWPEATDLTYLNG